MRGASVIPSESGGESFEYEKKTHKLFYNLNNVGEL